MSESFTIAVDGPAAAGKGTLSKALAAEGIELLDGIEEYSYGKFAHILDPDGRKIELWEPNNVEYMTMTEGNTTK